MLKNLRLHYIDPMRGFSRPARLFLAMIVIDGIIYSAWQLFFNFYILQRGYSREVLGIFNSLPSAAALILGIPLGRLSDRIGGRASIIAGITLSGVFMLAQVTVREPGLIGAAAFLYGAGNMLFIVSQAPLMARLSNRDNRTLLFSLSFGLQTLAGAVGAVFAGQLPGVFGGLLHVEAHSATAYQAVLITSVLLGTVSIVPMLMMKEPRIQPALPDARAPQPVAPTTTAASRRIPPSLLRDTVRMTAPQVLIGFGAAILIPYINVFFKYSFNISDSLLGVLFSLSSLFIGVGSVIGPRLTTVLGGKIRAIVATQASSLMFLLLVGFSPYLWLSSVAYLARTTLMNMASPLYSAFCMERAPEQHQGFVNSVLNLAWSLGWAIGPFLSGVVQQQSGFAPLFVATSVLYGLAILLIWIFFKRSDIEAASIPAPVRSPEFVE
jgi:MFS family permease